MDISKKVKTNRAFIKKVRYFIKTYPLIRKDPQHMIQSSIQLLVNKVESAKRIEELEGLSETAKKMVEHTHPEDLYQFPVDGDDYRFIVYRPCKFLDSGYKQILDLYDLLFIPYDG